MVKGGRMEMPEGPAQLAAQNAEAPHSHPRVIQRPLREQPLTGPHARLVELRPLAVAVVLPRDGLETGAGSHLDATAGEL